MKRIILIFTILIMISICVYLAIEAPNQESSETTHAAVVNAVWFSDISSWDPPMWRTEEGTITGEITRATGLTLDMSIPMSNADIRLSILISSGNLPDIISVSDDKIISHLTKSEKVWNLQELLETYVPESHLLNDFPQDVKDVLVERDGAWYALASHMNSEDNRRVYSWDDEYWSDITKYSDENTIIWNLPLLKRLGIEEDELATQDQIMDIFEKAMNRELDIDGNDIIPLLVDGVDFQSTTMVALQNFFGAELLDEDGNYQDRILAPQTKDALTFLNSNYRSGYLYANNFTIDNSQVCELLASGRVLCFIGDVTNKGINESDWFSSAPIITSNGASPILGIEQQTNDGWISTFVSKDCKNPEVIANWLDYMTSKEGMLLSWFGHETEDYIIMNDGLVVRTEQGMADAKNYDQTGVSAWWPFFNTDWYFSISKEPETGSAEYNKYQILTALGRYDKTAIYDSSLVNIPADYIDANTFIGELETKINQLKKSWLTTVVLSDSRAAFDSNYVSMIGELNDSGLTMLDNKKDIKYEENCEKYGSLIVKVN